MRQRWNEFLDWAGWLLERAVDSEPAAVAISMFLTIVAIALAIIFAVGLA